MEVLIYRTSIMAALFLDVEVHWVPRLGLDDEEPYHVLDLQSEELEFALVAVFVQRSFNLGQDGGGPLLRGRAAADHNTEEEHRQHRREHGPHRSLHECAS